MKLKFLFTSLFISLILISCQENRVDEVQTIMTDDLATLVSDEVISDINFSDLDEEGDDGSFFGDILLVDLKSASLVTCFIKEVAKDEEKWVITYTYSGDCARAGTIIIEYYKPNDEGVKKKVITYIDFVRRGVTYNGVKTIEHGNGIHYISADMEVDKINDEGVAIHIVRDFERQMEWICGQDTRWIKDDNMKMITGSSEITKTIGDEELSYSKQIVEPLYVVGACELKIQAGKVQIEKVDGTMITIDYGDMSEIDCESDFDCDNTFEVTKGDETFTVEFVDGERVRQVDSEE